MNYELKNKKKNGRASIFYFPFSTRSSRGFTLIETVVAIAVLSIAITVPLSLAQRSLSSSLYAQDQVTAFYLAQEAVEYARNVRDTNTLSNSATPPGWLAGLDACLTSFNPNQACGIDVTAASGSYVVDCGANPASYPTLCRLTFNSQTGVYGMKRNDLSWRNTIFTRALQITPVSIGANSNAADLTATVWWTSGTISRSMVVNERIFNWHPAAAQ